MRYAPLIFLLLCACAGQAQQPNWRDSGRPLEASQHYDVVHYTIDIAVEPDSRSIGGSVTMTAVRTDTSALLTLDLSPDLTVASVRVDGLDARFEHTMGGRLNVALSADIGVGDTMRVRVDYGGKPHVAVRAPWDGGLVWAQTPGGDPWIATAVQGEGCDVWWPCLDHPTGEPDSVAIHITVPGNLVVASNGILRGIDQLGDGRARYRWHSASPINTYNVALNIAPYVQRDTIYSSVAGVDVPVTLYVLPERTDRAGYLLGEMLAHLSWYEQVLGPYPWRAEKYGVAHTPHLGMEHQTIIAYGSDFSDERDGFDWLHHHELGHEWWGNLVTAPSWNDFWIHEGFCTYMQALYLEHLFGADAYRARVTSYQPTFRNEVPVAPREPHTTDEMYFSTRGSNPDIYNKGAAVLHTLRYAMGDSLFRVALRRFAYPDTASERATDGSQARFATTDDFQSLVGSLTGDDYTDFFEVYLRTAELPRLVEERGGDRPGNTLVLRWDAPVAPDFSLPIEIEVDSQRMRVEMPGGRGEVLLPSPDAVVVIDPDNWVIRGS